MFLQKITPFILIALAFACMYACTNNKSQNLYQVAPKKDTTSNNKTDTSTIKTVTSDTSVCFQRDVLPIFVGSCAMAGCHSAASRQKGYILTDYANIRRYGVNPGYGTASKLYTECASGQMPESPIPKLDSTQLSLIRRWIDNGATNDTDCAIVCDTSKYTYSTGVVPILKNYCYSCHASAAAPTEGGGIVLDNYSNLQLEAQNGNLLSDVEHVTGHNFMPLGGAKLPDCMITQIKKWIAAGAPNN